MKAEILITSNNTGKLKVLSQYLEPLGIPIKSPESLGIELDVEETGSTLEQNALLKAYGFQKLAPNMIIVADDTAVEIDKLAGQPGIHARRWKDHQTTMTDQEIIQHCLEQLHGVPIEQRGAQYRTVICLLGPGTEPEFFDGVLRGILLEHPKPQWLEGFPFDSLFYLPDFGCMIDEIRDLPAEQRPNFISQRERAIQSALPKIKKLFASQ